MDKEDIKEVILQILEIQLNSQLRAIRNLQGKPDTEPAPSIRPGRRRQSLVDLSIKILTADAGCLIGYTESKSFRNPSSGYRSA